MERIIKAYDKIEIRIKAVKDFFDSPSGFFLTKSIWGWVLIISLAITGYEQLEATNKKVVDLTYKLEECQKKNVAVSDNNLNYHHIFNIIDTELLGINDRFKSLKKEDKKSMLRIHLSTYLTNQSRLYRDFIAFIIEYDKKGSLEVGRESSGVLLENKYYTLKQGLVNRRKSGISFPYYSGFSKLVNINESTVDVNKSLRELESCSVYQTVNSLLALEAVRLKNLIVLLETSASEIEE